MRNSNRTNTLGKIVLPLTLLVAACGGGGGSSSGTDYSYTPAPGGGGNGGSTQSPPPASTPPASSTPAPSNDTASQKSGPCADTYGAGFVLVEGKDATSLQASLAKPSRGVPFSDPVYGSCTVRVTNAKAEGMPGFARNDYSRRQPFNADDSRVLVYAQGGMWQLYDVETLAHVAELDLGGTQVEPQWHAAHPDLLYVFPHKGGMTITEHNVADGSARVAADFREVAAIAGYPGSTSINDIWPEAARVWTRSEGSPSSDGRYWALIVETRDSRGLGLITYDMLANEIVGVYDFARDGGGVGAPDHVSMSPSGNYVVPSWTNPVCSGSRLGTRSQPCGMMSFSRDFATAIGLNGRSPHSDIGFDADGREVVVATDYDSGWVEMWELSTGAATRLWELYENGSSAAMHFSARNFSKPGWVLVSTYKGKGSAWFSNKIMAVELRANPRILNIAHTYNTGGDYFSEPHAAVNRDFTKVMFNSNWKSSSDTNVDAYMIELPEEAVPAHK